MSPNTTQTPGNVPAVLLVAGRSPASQGIFWFFVALTLLALFADFKTSGGPSFPSWGCMIICVWQALRTYVVRTVFTSQNIRYRSALGVWHHIDYFGVLVERRGAKSLILHGRDQAGRMQRITFFRRHADLDRIAKLIANQRL